MCCRDASVKAAVHTAQSQALFIARVASLTLLAYSDPFLSAHHESGMENGFRINKPIMKITRSSGGLGDHAVAWLFAATGDRIRSSSSRCLSNNRQDSRPK